MLLIKDSKYMKQKQIELKWEMDKSTIIMGNNTLQWVIDRQHR